MSGGLIQLVTSGKQDVALTLNPQITFFKKVYRRHTNFSLELKEHNTNQQSDWGDTVSFSLNNGDLVHRCFIQIEIPKLSFNDSIINNSIYLAWKADYINRSVNEQTKWNTLYTNFKNYVSIELLLYQKLQILFMSDNITLNSIKETVVRFNNTYSTQKNLYANLIDIDIFNKINISGYIISINKLLTYDIILPNNNYISLITIKSNLENKKNSIYEYLNYYHKNLKQITNKVTQINSNKINFAWSEFLGHYFFSQFELEIGGQIIEHYTSDQLHIYQSHSINEEYKENYFKMIGHIDDLINYEKLDKPNTIIYCPLLFWFCKKPGAALPIIAMKNTSVSINLTINKIKNLLYFRDWEYEYNTITKLTVINNTYITKDLVYYNYIYDKDSKKITYNLKYINSPALSLIYNLLKPSDIVLILEKFGVNNIITLNEWINFRNNLSNYPDLLNKIGGYDNYIDYNYLMNQIPKPNVKLLAEYIFLDDIEREKFASSKLEYVIETFQENAFDVKNLPLFDAEFAIDRPNKYLKWFVQPKIFLNGLSEYGKVYPWIYDFKKFFKNNVFTKQIILLNQIELLNKHLDPTFYEYVTTNKSLNNSLPEGIYFYNFSLFPEDSQPSGTSNLTVIKEKKFRYEMDPNFLKEYFNSPLNKDKIDLQLKILSLSYNFFAVHNGIGRLIFAS